MNKFAHLFFGKHFFAFVRAFIQKKGKKPAKIFNAILAGKHFIKAIKAAEFVLHFVDRVQTEKQVPFAVKGDRETSVFNCAHNSNKREAVSSLPLFPLSIFD